ncbi:LOB domain-containing protein 36-like protein [Tanacetum coccineum]
MSSSSNLTCDALLLTERTQFIRYRMKILNELSTSYREDVVHTLPYEADVRLRDPVYGCVIIASLLQEIELAQTKAEIAFLGAA